MTVLQQLAQAISQLEESELREFAETEQVGYQNPLVMLQNEYLAPY